MLSGLGGTLIVDQVLGALTGHFLALWWLGALLVLAAATVTMAFQTLLGVIGIGLTVLVFVVLGNPSAGGAYQPALLPPFWRALNYALPNGAGTDTVRSIAYVGGHNITGHLIVIASYAAAGGRDHARHQRTAHHTSVHAGLNAAPPPSRRATVWKPSGARHKADRRGVQTQPKGTAHLFGAAHHVTGTRRLGRPASSQRSL